MFKKFEAWNLPVYHGLAAWSSSDPSHLDACELLDEVDILLRLLREVGKGLDAGDGLLPSFELLVLHLYLSKQIKVSWEGLELFAGLRVYICRCDLKQLTLARVFWAAGGGSRQE